MAYSDKKDELTEEDFKDLEGQDPFTTAFGQLFGDAPLFAQSYRPQNGGGLFYCPARDILYLMPYIIRCAVWMIKTYNKDKVIRGDIHYFNWCDRVLLYDDLVKAFSKLKELLEQSAALGKSYTSLKDVCKNIKWDTIDKNCVSFIMSAIGQVLVGVYFTSMFNSNLSEEKANITLESTYTELEAMCEVLHKW